MIHHNFVYLGLLISLAGSLSYVRDTLRGKTQPNRVTWLLWAIFPMVAAAAMIDEQAGGTVVTTMAFGIGPALIFTASFANKQSVWRISRFDWICGASALAGLALWAITRDGLTAISLSIAADLLAGLPTLRKAWQAPETESALVYVNASANACIGLLALQHWSVEGAAFPLYILLICLTTFLLIVLRIGPRLHGRYTTR